MKQNSFDVRWLQRALHALGYYSGEIDGISGPQTRAAIVAFKAAIGFRVRPYVGPKTLAALAEAFTPALPKKFGPGANPMPPWVSEISKYLGLHERHDNALLQEWLRSDGSTLGDPAKLPWCGDAAITALVNALPDEVLPDDLEVNPYWARNFAEYGQACGYVYGAVAAFSRGKGGHVGFVIGYDSDRRRFLVLGGNQGDAIRDDTWIAESRLIALRWPMSWSAAYQRPLPLVDASGAILSTNEA